MDGKAHLYVLDKKTGKPVWTAPREANRACYSAPTILENGANGTELLVTSTTAITSYNPDTGSRNWNWNWAWPPKLKPMKDEKPGLRTIATSMEEGGMLVASSGDGAGDRFTVGVKLPSAPGAQPTEMWNNRKEFPYVPCLLSRNDHVYFVNDYGFAGCFDVKKGTKVWYERLPGATFTASPIMIDGKIYAASEEGDVFVIAAEPKFELLATNRLGERIRATPAVADGRLFVRGQNTLYCFGKKN
jgi:outer membrane protein assembly factor BamB